MLKRMLVRTHRNGRQNAHTLAHGQSRALLGPVMHTHTNNTHIHTHTYTHIRIHVIMDSFNKKHGNA